MVMWNELVCGKVKNVDDAVAFNMHIVHYLYLFPGYGTELLFGSQEEYIGLCFTGQKRTDSSWHSNRTKGIHTLQISKY